MHNKQGGTMRKFIVLIAILIVSSYFTISCDGTQTDVTEVSYPDTIATAYHVGGLNDDFHWDPEENNIFYWDPEEMEEPKPMLQHPLGGITGFTAYSEDSTSILTEADFDTTVHKFFGGPNARMVLYDLKLGHKDENGQFVQEMRVAKIHLPSWFFKEAYERYVKNSAKDTL